MNRSALRRIARPLAGLALAAALVGVPAATASAVAVPTENQYCDWESGYGCASYGYRGYPSEHGWDYGDGWYRRHARHHRY